jgi:thiol peroxidase
MTTERFGIVKFRGQAVTVLGQDLRPGDVAPEFYVQTLDWAPFSGLANTVGKVRIITALPSLDTEVCDRETRRFNQEAAVLGKDIVILSTAPTCLSRRNAGAARPVWIK